ncbi:MAG: N-acetylmuramoyl-L-alanine amidase [Gammaproteobacteria bacterium]|jgi:N-acetylmuramoyl-L-alanine amidase
MRRGVIVISKFLLMLALSLAGVQVSADPVSIERIRAWPAPDHTRVVFDVAAPVEHSLFMLKNPDRVVVDLRNARLATKLPRSQRDDPLLARVRAGSRSGGDLRVVFDLRAGVRPRSFMLKPNAQYGHRLVIDLQAHSSAPMRKVSAKSKTLSHTPRNLIIALDPGHGGEDPGAIGPARTREKTVVLKIAQRLQRLIDREPGMRAVLTRKSDYYVGLRKRMEIARAHGADLFVSIHADAFQDKRVSGSSVYILSRGGASSEAARWLAEQENAADLVGGVSLDDKDEVLASVLLDLSQTATISASTDVATQVLNGLKRVGRTHKRHVERAGFMVLKSPDIPSILVETAFLSNPEEERKLNSAAYQRKLAAAVLSGIRTYFRESPPPGTMFETRRHIIANGDTLSAVAVRYGVSLARLRTANELNDDLVRIGQVLNIPAGS